eukprot:TRINITY_DN5197_c0_g1_i1.p1 TRINITY_DN5197_c0_g1~~TRINITY_DN5197_c0_g1_i1.p1  ORF type:complete len:117 (+),score=4.48 TRINITY_DN5197_c0_g1_i1:111-461(+)
MRLMRTSSILSICVISFLLLLLFVLLSGPSRVPCDQDDMGSNRRLHFFVSGRVQGVYFRKFTREKAISLGLVGWAKNLLDGRVEVLTEGSEEAIQQLVRWCRHEGSPLSRVSVHER